MERCKAYSAACPNLPFVIKISASAIIHVKATVNWNGRNVLSDSRFAHAFCEVPYIRAGLAALTADSLSGSSTFLSFVRERWAGPAAMTMMMETITDKTMYASMLPK